MMKKYLLLLIMLSAKCGFAQLNESFSDGNFTVSPEWKGDVVGFSVDAGKQLQTTSNTATQTFALSTANPMAMNTKWEFFVQMNFDPSANNLVRVYLTSDNENLRGSLSGYFIQIGETGSADSYDLYKQTGTSITKIIDGAAKTRVSASQLIARVQVLCTSEGVWELKTDITGSSNFTSEGTVTDTTFPSSAWFGVYCKYTTTNSDKIFFDDFKIETLVNDIIAPKLVSVSAVDSVTVEVIFDEPLDSLSAKILSNYSLNNGYSVPISVFTTSDPARYRLKFMTAFKTGAYILLVSGVKDRSGNLLAGTATASFNYIKPYVAAKNELVINEIFADPSPQIDLPSVEFVELFNTTNHSISLRNWKYADASTIFTFAGDSIRSGQFLILSAKADTAEFKQFGKTIGISPWPSLNNNGDILKLTSPENRVIDSVSYSDTWYRNTSKKQGGWTLERIDPGCSCTGMSNWSASSDSTGGTPGRQNSIFKSGYIFVSLRADSVKQLSDSTISVYFNKPVDKSTITAAKFILDPLPKGNATISLNDEFTRATFKCSSKFTAATVYKLSISNISDQMGNLIDIVNQPLTFLTPEGLPVPPTLPERLDTAKLMITEIFADPSPEVGLPLVEFVEIYNPGNDIIDLDGWTLNDPGTTATITKSSILAKQYVILCPAADTLQYKPFGKAIGVSPWPSLNNASDQIILKSFKGRSTDSISYSDTWYKSSQKKAGGWTLERIDPQCNCEPAYNWGASIDVSGGTPGRQNSIYNADYHLIAPTADSLKRLSDSTVKVYFNKPVNKASLQSAKFVLTPAQKTAPSISLNDGSTEVTLSYPSKFESSTLYKLLVFGLTDYAGNVISIQNQSLSFLTPNAPIVPLPVKERLDTGMVTITEIFADPSPEVGLPLVEFIEIYNPGTDTIDLNGWSVNDPMTKGIIMKTSIFPKQYLILCPAVDTLQYKPFGKTIGISPWPSLNNSSEQVFLKSFKGRMVDSVSYSDSWYKDPQKKAGGWTLEKIDPSVKTSNFYSWSASLNSSGGTPGKVNSHDPYENKIIKVDSVAVTSDSTLRVYLNSIPDTAFVKTSCFNVDGHKVVKATLGSDFKTVNLDFVSHFEEDRNYILTIDSIMSYTGSVIDPIANQKSFLIPGTPEISYSVIINEIFADPSPQIGLPDTEFIELYNPTDLPVSLKGMIYQDESGTKFTFKKGEVEARGFLILCSEKDTLTYKPLGKTLGISSWPSLNNDKDILILKNNKGREFHRVSYNSSWYKNKEKAAGGWSLELIDPQTICSGIQNWMSSSSPAGGTPGKQNSVYKLYATNDPLKITGVLLTDSATLELSFNRPVDSVSAAAIRNYKLNNGVGNPLSVLPAGPDFEKVQLRFGAGLTRGKQYQISLTGVTDCAGIAITQTIGSADFLYPDKILNGDIIINELLFNPRPGGVDFVEIYNKSDKILDLKDLYLSTLGAKDSIVSAKQLSGVQLLIQPHRYVAITSDPDNIRKEYSVPNGTIFVKLSSIPAFNDDAGVVVLVSGTTRIDQLNYTEKMHFALIKNAEGVSLERSSFSRPANEPGNFRSAAESAGFATPGYKNSQYADDIAAVSEEVSLNSKTFSPDNDGFEDILTLNYHFVKPGFIANAAIYDSRGALIRKLAKNQTLAAEGVIIWDGLTEVNEKCAVGIYMIYLEVFNLDGTVKKYRKNCVLAAKLD